MFHSHDLRNFSNSSEVVHFYTFISVRGHVSWAQRVTHISSLITIFAAMFISYACLSIIWIMFYHLLIQKTRNVIELYEGISAFKYSFLFYHIQFSTSFCQHIFIFLETYFQTFLGLKCIQGKINSKLVWNSIILWLVLSIKLHIYACLFPTPHKNKNW